MIIGKISPGSGLGDMLFSYIAIRVRAADLGVPFGFVGKEFFKGASFMNLDWGAPIDYKYHTEQPSGLLVIDDPHKLFVVNTPYFNPEFNFVQDGTVIDGYGAQALQYFEHRLPEIREWLKVDEVNDPREVCVINFRGGEYATVPELFLPLEYWTEAQVMMLKKYPDITFEVHTDDPILAKKFFPKLRIVLGIKENWQAIRYAKHLIISNSAFAIIPALLNENVKEVIAPRYWSRRNIKQWISPQNYYKKFKYI